MEAIIAAAISAVAALIAAWITTRGHFKRQYRQPELETDTKPDIVTTRPNVKPLNSRIPPFFIGFVPGLVLAIYSLFHSINKSGNDFGARELESMTLRTIVLYILPTIVIAPIFALILTNYKWRFIYSILGVITGCICAFLFGIVLLDIKR
jgi:hypothetical protein